MMSFGYSHINTIFKTNGLKLHQKSVKKIIIKYAAKVVNSLKIISNIDLR